MLTLFNEDIISSNSSWTTNSATETKTSEVIKKLVMRVLV